MGKTPQESKDEFNEQCTAMKTELELIHILEAKSLPDNVRCLVIDDKGVYSIGIWDSIGFFVTESSMIYDSGSEKIENVVGFIVNKYK